MAAGLVLAASGAAWISQIDPDTAFFPGIGVPLLIMGIGMAAAFTTLTTAAIHGVGDGDAGAASGLVNVAHQLGGAIGVAVLVTVFAGAGGDGGSAAEFAHGLGAALTGSAACLALALIVVVGVMWRPALGREPATSA
jgi:hypothetical protein